MIETAPKRYLSNKKTATPKQVLQALAGAAGDDAFDHYGVGAAVQELEREVAALLGKEAAVADRSVHAVAEARGLVLFERLAATPDPRSWSFELVVGPNTTELRVDDIRAAFAELAAHASTTPGRSGLGSANGHLRDAERR